MVAADVEDDAGEEDDVGMCTPDQPTVITDQYSAPGTSLATTDQPSR